MPSEPSHNMEDLLRAYAKKRREQAGSPLELHPVDRKMLQDEVARKFRPSTPRSHWRLWGALWPRLALATGLAAAVTCALFWHVMFKKPAQMEMAQNNTRVASNREDQDSNRDVRKDQSVKSQEDEALVGGRLVASDSAAQESKASKSVSASSTAISSRAKAVKSEDMEKKEMGEVPVASEALSNNNLIAGKATTLADRQEDARIRADGKNAQNSLSKAQKPAASTAASGEVLFGDEIPATAPPVFAENAPAPAAAPNPQVKTPALATTMHLDFQTVENRSAFRRSLAVQPSSDVLSSFSVERNGQQVRVTDEDGSVYVGQVVTPSTDSLHGQVDSSLVQRDGNADKKADLSSGAVSQDSFDFRVMGTNRRLNQVLVFNGTLQSAAPVSSQQALESPKQKSAPQANRGRIGGFGGGMPQVQNSQQSASISGSVQIGTTNTFQLKAQQSAPR